MNIAVESYACVRMTKQFAESLWVEAIFNTNGCVSMTKKMKIYISDTADFQYRLKAILHSSRFGRLASSGDYIKIVAFSFLL